MAMLEDLEKGLRRAQAAQRFVNRSVAREARPAHKRQAGSGAAARRAHIAIRTFDRTLAMIVFLWVASVIWCLMFGLGVESGAGTPVAGGAESAHASKLRDEGADTVPRQPLSASKGAEASVPKDGLSAEEFEREVRRVLSENRKRTRASRSETNAADYPGEPDYAFPLEKGESFPEPLAPPTAAKTGVAESSPVEAVAQTVDTPRLRAPKIVKAKAATEKAGKLKCAKKPPPPAQADEEPRGPSSLVAAAKETISGVIRNWSR